MITNTQIASYLMSARIRVLIFKRNFYLSSVVLSDNNSPNNTSNDNSNQNLDDAPSPDSSFGEAVDSSQKIAERYTTRDEIEEYFDRKKESVRNSNLSEEEKTSLISELTDQEDDVKDINKIPLGPLSTSASQVGGDETEQAHNNQNNSGSNIGSTQDSSDITADVEPFDFMSED